MATSSTFSGYSFNRGSHDYPYPSHVNAASFLSIKLSGKSNYAQWQEQMTCLLDSYDMLGFIDGTIQKPQENNGSKAKADVSTFEAMHREWKRSDTLVKGWIYGSLSEDVMGTVVGLQTANDVWNKLKENYTTPSAPAPVTADPPKTSTKKKDVGEYVPLCRAIQMGDWEKAQEFFNEDQGALIDKLNVDGQRSLHIAIGNSENIGFLRNLLERIHPDSLPSLVNNKQQNALHYAAMLDNIVAAILLVEKNPRLLFCVDYQNYLPIQKAIFNSHEITFHYLLMVCKQHVWLNKEVGNHNPFEGEKGVSLLNNAILSGFFHVAAYLLHDNPELARTKVTTFKAPLWCMAKKWDAYRSAEQYNFYQRFVYYLLPTEDYNTDNTDMIQDIENQEETNQVNMGQNSSFVYPDVPLPPPAYIPYTYNNPDIENQETEEENPLCKESCLPPDVPDAETPETYNYNVNHGVYPSGGTVDPLNVHLPTAHHPVIHPPAVHLPTVHPPDVHLPTVHHPVVHPPAVHHPVVHPPTVHQPTIHLPDVHPPTVHHPVVHPPIVQHPVVHPPVFYPSSLQPPSVYPPAPSLYPPSVYPPAAYPPGVHPPHNPYGVYRPGAYPDAQGPYGFPGPFPATDNQHTRPVTNIKFMERIYVKFWKVVLLYVLQIKRLCEDKMKHEAALTILMFICNEIGKLNSDHDRHYGDAFIEAVKNDTPEVIEQIIRFFPQSIWTRNNGYSLSQLSIMNRCEKVFNFFVQEVTHEKYLHNVCVDEDENNLLHLAGKLAPTHKLNMVNGAALQMQRELQWFQEVSKLVRPKDREAKNKKQETPIMVFRKEHKELRQKGEEWMKKTADSYTITAALIITIVFAGAITVPGGNNGETGKAILETKPSFIIFAVSDAISLFTSTTSLLLFLSILTARCAEDDFLYKLPKRLILGLAMLFMSVTTMMIAFSATLYIMFGQENSWVLIAIASITCLPIASFVTLQLPLLIDLIASTYSRGIFGKQNEFRTTS